MLSEAPEQRKLAAIMFTDMVGYSALSQRDDKLALALLEEHRELLREIFPRFHGTEIKTIGDAFLVEFNSALEAAQCAIEIQRALAKRNADVPPDRRIELKIGIHIGDVVHRGGDVYGDGVNIASRIEPLAGAGGICVSMDVERQIRNALEARLEKLAPTELKNISVPMDLFRIVLPWERPGTPVARTQAKTTSRKFVSMAIALVLLLIVGLGWWWTTLPRKTAAIGVASLSPASNERGSIPPKSIAVLPFENLSSEKENAYFADGIQDEILTKLAGITDLKVISRTSTAKYKSKPEDLKVVSQQLGVANVVEGTVQRAADKVRVNVQLIDARADTHLWAKSYDRDLKDVFAVESEVSQEIADALQAKLSPAEADTLATAPTRDPAAYDLFLKGEYEAREALATREPEAFDKATRFYQQAIARDPGFALAIARMVENQMLRHWFITRLGEADLGEIKRRAERAVALAANLPQAHIALGACYYYGYRQYDQALSEFQRAIELQPNNVQALEYCGYVHLRQGRMQEGLSELEKSEQLDPRDDKLMANIGSVFLGLRMWKEASHAGLRALALNPNNAFGMNSVLFSPVNARGDINEATRILGTFPSDAVLSTNGYQIDGIIGGRAYLDVIKRAFGAALRVWEKENSDSTATRQRLSARAAIHVLAGDATSAQGELENGRTLVEARLREKPDDQNALIELAWIDLAQNRDSDALSLAQKSADLLPPEKDAVGGPSALTGLAQVQARAGETAEAVKNLRRLLSLYAGESISIARLKIDPIWDPIRNDPGFQQLLTMKEHVGP